MIAPKLSLDLTSGILSHLVTFSRTGATATRVNSSGYIEPVAADTPRFDYDPVTLACKGLLIEDQRTNLLTYSEQFNDASWSKLDATISANAAAAPDNTLTADKLIASATATAHSVFKTFTSLTTNTFSCYLKAGEYTWGVLRIEGNSTFFNLSTGAVGTSAAGNTASITPAGNGWYRCSVTRNVVTVGTAATLRPATANNTDSFTGDGVSGIFIWGVQLEAGASATSYIPTTTAALTRNADVATITGTNFNSFWQAGRGGVLVRALPSTVSGTRPLVQFDDNTADNIIALRGNTTNPELYIVDGGTPQAQIDAGTIAANTAYDLTGWWQTNFCAARKDNGARVEDLTATIPTVTQARLGSDGTNYLNGHLATINYYARFSSQIYSRRKNKAVFNVI
jgi:hypothetical protein